MKTYNQFLEAISPTRLAQLKAKGKGEAAARQMKADGTSPGPHQGNQEKVRRVAQGNTPQNKGGALVKSSPNNSALKSVSKDLAMKGAKAAANKGMAIVKSKMQTKQQQNSGSPGDQRAVNRGRYGAGTGAHRAKSKADEAKRRAMDKLKQSKVDDKKGGFYGGVKKSFGGDLIHKDDKKRNDARFDRGKAMADGLKSSAAKALSHGQGGGERFSGSGSGTGTNLKRGGGRGGD